MTQPGAANPAPREDQIVVGAIAGAYGVRGEARVKAFTAEPEAVFTYAPFVSEDGTRTFTPVRWRAIKAGFAVVFKEVTTREEVEALKSVRLAVPRARMPVLEEDEFYYADLVGMRVENLAGAPLGEVRAIHDFGAGDMVEVWRTPDVKESWYLPFTKAAVPHVDVTGRVLVADPEPGIIPGDEPEGDEDGEGPAQ